MKQYDLILADPPWSYNDKKRNRGGAECHYRTMPDQELLDFGQVLEPHVKGDTILCLWATWPRIPLAIDLIQNWGFHYKTLLFEWIKTNENGTPYMGMGSYTRANCEPLLLAFRSRSGIAPRVRNISNVLFARRQIHSRKPDLAYQRIEQLWPDVSRLELFARHKRDGWDVWGNEVESDVEIGSEVKAI
jgi:site-specific DNA-methyltransferase (adenine-specific)